MNAPVNSSNDLNTQNESQQVGEPHLPQRVNLLGYDRIRLQQLLVSIGDKAYRADQILKWIYHCGVTDFAEMTNISKDLRTKLADVAVIQPPEVHSQQIAIDGTRKWLFKVEGGSLIETVYIPEPNRTTVCISSQAGCSLNCSFCYTAKQGFHRDLQASEIIGQLWVVHNTLAKEGKFLAESQRTISNIVMMGMGEPLMNFDNVVIALSLMQEDLAFGLSKKRVTLSTSGVVPNIDKLAEVSDVSLAVSLHAPNNELRDILVPLNKKYPIEELLAACQRYIGRFKRRQVTMEYVMIRDVNDTPTHAKQLAKLLRHVPSKINLIPFNPFPGTQYERSTDETIEKFQTILMQSGYVTMVRRTRGDDILAACGQLAGKVKDRTYRQLRFLQSTASS